MFNNYRNLKANGAKVVLTGEGADEMFFGYYHRFPGFKNPMIRSADEFRTVWGGRLPLARSLLANTTVADLEDLRDLAIDRFYAPIAAAGADPDRCMQCWYLSTFLHWLLIDNDRCSMAFSLEGRFPFLNREIYELAFRIPPSAQLGSNYGEEKLTLRNAFKEFLPEEIWHHRKKAPLPSPLKLAFHITIRDALSQSVREAPEEIWDVLDRDGVTALLAAYAARIAKLENAHAYEDGGEDLTRYLSLNEPWEVRTPHVFGLLTVFRWWKINFT
jgi:asparagine synthase (glutamine-hydrolysing)